MTLTTIDLDKMNDEWCKDLLDDYDYDLNYDGCDTVDDVTSKITELIDRQILNRLRLEIRKDKFAERFNNVRGYDG